jgi:CBS domain-containing protein
MLVRNVMRRNIEAVTPETPLREAARKMSLHNITMLPVCNGPRVVGLLTARDLIVRATAQGCDPQTSQVSEVMTFPPVCGREDQPLEEAADLTRRWQMRRLPILDQQLRLVGIVSLDDLQETVVDGKSRSHGK